MSRHLLTLVGVCGAAVVLSSGLILTAGQSHAQEATPTPTSSGPASQTPTVEPVLAPGADLTPTRAITPVSVTEGGTITVEGIGQVSTTPDSAVIELGVENRAMTASVALSQTNTQVQSLLDALVAAGVAEDDIQTRQVNLFPVYNPPPDPADQQVLTGFNASNIIRVRVRDLDSLGELLDTAVEAGANTIQAIQFEVSDPADQMTQAREQAIDDARLKAEQLATLLGASLGEVHAVVETGGAVPIAGREAIGAASAVPIAPGTETVQVVVQVTWRLQSADAE